MDKKYKIGCFIMCRMSSVRLPGKALLKIKGKSVIRHIIERAKLMSSAEVVVLCTSTDKSDDVLVDIAEKCGIKSFRGPLDDVLERFLGAAQKFSVDLFAIYSADNLFCDPMLMDLGISQMIEGSLDFINIPEDLVCGGAAYCVSTPALIKACRLKKDNNTEYYPKYFTSDNSYSVCDLRVDDSLYHNMNVRLTLDYPEDVEFVNKIFDEFNTDFNNISLRNILGLLERKPEIAKINLFRQRDWSNNQKSMKVST